VVAECVRLSSSSSRVLAKLLQHVASAESFAPSLESLITPESLQTQTSACYDGICISSALQWNYLTSDYGGSALIIYCIAQTSADNPPVKRFQ
jgi:hypothetical protein